MATSDIEAGNHAYNAPNRITRRSHELADEVSDKSGTRRLRLLSVPFSAPIIMFSFRTLSLNFVRDGHMVLPELSRRSASLMPITISGDRFIPAES